MGLGFSTVGFSALACRGTDRGARHLEHVLGAYVAHYVDERPHRGLGLAVPAGIRPAQVPGATPTPVEQRDVLGGLIHEYRRAA